ncbi:MAG: hypothetical protein P4L83_00185 [Nevskia sp.]|nr:hypothetical protein [Nevskia sp.]
MPLPAGNTAAVRTGAGVAGWWRSCSHCLAAGSVSAPRSATCSHSHATGTPRPASHGTASPVATMPPPTPA